MTDAFVQIIGTEEKPDPYFFQPCIGQGALGHVYQVNPHTVHKVTSFLHFADFGIYLKEKGSTIPLTFSYDGRAVYLDNRRISLGSEQLNALCSSLHEYQALLDLKGAKNIVCPKEFNLCIDFEGKVSSVLAMDYVPGECLSKLVAQNKLSPHQIAKGIADIAAALEKVHEKEYVHADVKPSNILFSETENLATLIDFSICRNTGRNEKRTSFGQDKEYSILSALNIILERGTSNSIKGIVKGTRGYMSPEQAAGISLTPESDVFSLAVSCINSLTRNNTWFDHDKDNDSNHNDISHYLISMLEYDNGRRSRIISKSREAFLERYNITLPDDLTQALEQALDVAPQNRQLKPLFDAAFDFAQKGHEFQQTALFQHTALPLSDFFLPQKTIPAFIAPTFIADTHASKSNDELSDSDELSDDDELPYVPDSLVYLIADTEKTEVVDERKIKTEIMRIKKAYRRNRS